MGNAMQEGIVFDIQKFCINDGPGIRTTVFLKGCTLNCAWCHNPESKSFLPQLSFKEDKCIMCGACQAVCPNNVHTVKDGVHTINYDACQACGLCVKACPTDALIIYGKKMNTQQVLDEVIKDKPFYDHSNGGMTLSGGEALAQPEFAVELAKKAKENGVSVAIETALGVGSQVVLDIAPYVDWFLIDYKLTDPHDFANYIQGDPKRIMNNLKLLNELGSAIILRCPIIPGINDNSEHFKKIAEVANAYKSITHVELLPYHPMGKSKAHEIGVLYEIEAKIPEEETVNSWIQMIQGYGYEEVIQG
jgi:glycyl-radical enzyme activating protein